MDRICHAAEPVLVVPCNEHCQPGTDVCAHQCQFSPLLDLPLPIIAVHERDLPQVLILHRGATWGDALLFHRGRAVRHWKRIPTRPEVDAALANLNGTSEPADK
jgi:hypothetical protein